jgi:RNA polymerase sigma factor (sigma-70 family)
MSGGDARPRPTTPDQRGDEGELFECHAERLVRIVQLTLHVPRHVAEDACAFAWMQLLRTQPERDVIFAWLRVVATREALRLIRSQGRLGSFEEDPAEPEDAHMDKGADMQLALEAREALEHIAALTQQQVRIFSLHVAGLNYEEICEATGYSWTQVNRHLGRARARLRSRRSA